VRHSRLGRCKLPYITVSTFQQFMSRIASNCFLTVILGAAVTTAAIAGCGGVKMTSGVAAVLIPSSLDVSFGSVALEPIS
jgi:hypothetical protein